MTKQSLGVWVDDPVKDTLTGAYWDKLKDHGFSTAALMLEGLGNGFDPTTSPRPWRRSRRSPSPVTSRSS